MRKSGNLAAKTLDYITDFVKPGISTGELNDLCHNFIIANHGIPAPLNYKGFPKSICTSVNHVVCHGIPGPKILKENDIINIDVTTIVDGWHGDSSRMYLVGNAGTKQKKICQVAYDTMMKGIEAIKPGATLGDIGYAMQQYCQSQGLSIVKDYCGHGIGKIFHAEPAVLNYGTPGAGVKIKPGMFFTVEPMVNCGKEDTICSKLDGWTVTTRDKTLSAQFEHTIGITETGYEIFTLSPKGYHKPPYV
jgi:methionyl aminopeptidase